MPMMKLDQLRLGMTAAADVLNNRNQVLIPQGTVIEAPHLRALKIWGIASVPIVENGGKGHPREKTSGSQLKKEVLEEINRLFRPVYKKPLHPVIKTIIPVCAKAISQKQELTQSGRVFDSESPSFPLDEQAAGRLTVEEIIRNTKDLFSLPDIHNQLMAEINNPYSSAADIAGVVGNDPGLTARLLRIVNSAFYGFPSKIESVAQGVSILGTKELCDLALATSVIRVFDDALKGVVNMKRFWYHSVGCGVIAKELAVCRNETGVERFFVMGILHDIGRLVLFSQAPKEMAWALTSASEQEKPLYQVEKECLGFSHADLGHALLREWRLPEAYQEAVYHHHSPSAARRFKLETAIVHTADMLSLAMGMGGSGSTCISGFDPPAWDLLDIEPGFLPQIMKTSEQGTKDLIGVFND